MSEQDGLNSSINNNLIDMKKKILLTNIHPAPYIDLWISVLSKDYEVDTLYGYNRIDEKAWNNYVDKKFDLYSNYSFFRLLRKMKQYDLIIHAAGWGFVYNIILTLILNFFKTKVVFFADHPIVGDSKDSGVFFVLKKIIICSADYLFTASPSCTQFYKQKGYIDSRFVLYFPYLPFSVNSDIIDINRQRKNVLANGGKINLFIANRFIPRKGYDVVYDAFLMLKTNNLLDMFDIIIAGNGVELDYFKSKFLGLDNSIQFLEWVENDIYETLLQNCDVYLHASLFEPFGIPPIDALQNNKTVIVSDGVKSTSHYKPSDSLMIYKSTNATELFQNLKFVYLNKVNLYSQSAYNQQYVSSDYSSQHILETISSILS